MIYDDKITGTEILNYWFMNNLEFSFLFCSIANIQYLMSTAMYLKEHTNVLIKVRLKCGSKL